MNLKTLLSTKAKYVPKGSVETSKATSLITSRNKTCRP